MKGLDGIKRVWGVLSLGWNRACIAADAFLRRMLWTRRKNAPRSKTVLIVFQQVFGDAVLLLDSLPEYVRLFPKSEGYAVKLLIRPGALSFLRAVAEIPQDLQTEPVDFKRFLESYSYYREVVRRYRGQADLLIVPGTSLSAEIFSCANDAPRKVGLVRPMTLRRPLTMALFAKIAYTERVTPERDEMMLLRHRRLLRYLGSQDYKAKLPRLSPQERAVSGPRYCALCPGASVPEKRWPAEKFAEVADFIVETYGISVRLCGGADEAECGARLSRLVRHPERVVSHIGKTTFAEWASIIQYADFVVGNDSATIHLAAAARRPCVCITGVYDKGQFFPYQADERDGQGAWPTDLQKDMPCAWCRTVGYASGYGNPACKAAIRAGECALCVGAVTTDEVKNAILACCPAPAAQS